MVQPIKSEFLLDPNIIFLNHGSFGACPRVVFEQYQTYQRALESNPVNFFHGVYGKLIPEARRRLGNYLGVSGNDVVYFPNPTTALRMILRAYKLEPGDEILTTDVEYPSMVDTWNFYCHMTGARFIEHPIPFPIRSHEETVEAFWSGVTPRTKVIHISHIAVYNALIYPVAEICRRAREAGIFTIVDGAHAPGQIPLDLKQIGADVYLGACHKWMCTPKGAGFAYVRPEAQDRVAEHLAIPRGWIDAQTHQRTEAYPNGDSIYVNLFQYQGTSEPSAYLSVPAAIDFMQSHDWEAQRARCHDLARQTRQRVNDLTGLPPVSPDSTDYYSMMASFYIPREFQAKLSEELTRRNIVFVILERNHHLLMRISYQAYNSQDDADRLIETIEDVIKGKV